MTGANVAIVVGFALLTAPNVFDDRVAMLDPQTGVTHTEAGEAAPRNR